MQQFVYYYMFASIISKTIYFWKFEMRIIYTYYYFIDLKSFSNYCKHKLCFEIWKSMRWPWRDYYAHNTQYTNQSYSNGFLTIIGFAIKQMHEFFVRPFNGKRLFFITFRYSLFFNTIFRMRKVWHFKTIAVQIDVSL